MKPIAFIWLDSGNNLEIDGTIFIPTAEYQPSTFDETKPSKPKIIGHINQSAQLLQHHYGRELDSRVVGVDAFYALHGLFQFTSFSEAQFLNLMEAQLKTPSPAITVSKLFMLKNLRSNQSILRQHAEQLRQTISVIRARGFPEWPKCNDDWGALKVANHAAIQLETDFYYLLDRAVHLMSMYLDTINDMESAMRLQQLQKDETLKHGVLVMLLLIFTTSFFGMNFKQFGIGTLQLWLYPTVAFPLLIIALLAVVMNKTPQRFVYTYYYAELWTGILGNRFKRLPISRTRS